MTQYKKNDLNLTFLLHFITLHQCCYQDQTFQDQDQDHKVQDQDQDQDQSF